MGLRSRSFTSAPPPTFSPRSDGFAGLYRRRRGHEEEEDEEEGEGGGGDRVPKLGEELDPPFAAAHNGLDLLRDALEQGARLLLAGLLEGSDVPHLVEVAEVHGARGGAGNRENPNPRSKTIGRKGKRVFEGVIERGRSLGRSDRFCSISFVLSRGNRGLCCLGNKLRADLEI